MTREQESKCCNINVDDIAKFECQSSGSEGYNQSPCLKSYIRWVVRRRFRHTQSSHTTPGASMITRFDIRCMRTDAWVGWSWMTLELYGYCTEWCLKTYHVDHRSGDYRCSWSYKAMVGVWKLRKDVEGWGRDPDSVFLRADIRLQGLGRSSDLWWSWSFEGIHAQILSLAKPGSCNNA